MNAVISFLTSSSTAPKTREFLEGLGKVAAQKFVDSGVSLNQSVAGLVKENSLNQEQTKRVAEAANNATFSMLMQRDPGYITFDVADSSKCGGAPMHVKLAKPNYIPGEDFLSTEKLAIAMFGAPEEIEKEAAAPAEDLVVTRQSLAHLMDELEDAKSEALSKVADLQEYIANAVRTEELSLSDIYAALSAVRTPESFIKVACTLAGACEAPSGPSRIPNPKHPLLRKVAGCALSTKAYLKKKQALTPKISKLVEK